MRVLQLIDSLRPGGAERMAINLANSLVGKLEASFLCCTRLEGEFKNEILPEVEYLFLNKKNSWDIKAFSKLRRYLKVNEIDIIHAHGTSFFIASLLKFTGSSVKLIWHDHYGNRIYKSSFNFPVLYICSLLFDKTIVVNSKLEKWVSKNLLTSDIQISPNFISIPTKPSFQNKIKIDQNNFNIICIANFKAPKNHLNLLRAFKLLVDKYSDVFLILIGNDYTDNYSFEIHQFIEINNIQKRLKIINNSTSIFECLSFSDLGVLSSDIEGLPMVLLEYGMAKLPVVCTDVGDCRKVIGNDGILVSPRDSTAFASAMEEYYLNKNRRILDGNNLNYEINRKYVADNAISFYLDIYANTLFRLNS